ncbi:MAG: hypothetical protein ACKVVT_14235 [Dehalococcoidia bacterium]
MGMCAVELYWIPVAAGTPRAQRASLWLWEAFEAARARRPRATLYHSALKLHAGDGVTRTLELTPEFIGTPEPPIVVGAVFSKPLARWRLFRYQLRELTVERLPDEGWAVASPVCLSEEVAAVERVLRLAPSVPPHTWGRRLHGMKEMWTSDSAISWLLGTAGVDLTGVRPPPGGRAPGWDAGIRLATGMLRGRG